MDSTRFDRLARTIGHSRSRRQVLRSLAGLAAGGLALGGRELTYAQACKANGKTCKKNDQCCSKNCVGGTGSGSTAHSAGVCQPATGCGGSTTLCGTDCLDLTTDPANCGRCGNPCVSGACQNGECCTTGTCGSLTCPATADICTGPALSCGSGSISCYCHNVGGASRCGSRTGCQACTVGEPCTYNANNIGMCISCSNGQGGTCTSCFLDCAE